MKNRGFSQKMTKNLGKTGGCVAIHGSRNEEVKIAGVPEFTGLGAHKHVPKILVKIGRVSINEVRFTQFGEFSENFNGDRQYINLADLGCIDDLVGTETLNPFPLVGAAT